MQATEEARRLGLVMSTQDAQAAAELGRSFARLQAVLHRTFVQLGVALIPVFDKIQAAIGRQLEWARTAGEVIRQNSGLIVSVLKVAKTVLKVAAEFKTARFLLAQLALAFGLVASVAGPIITVLTFLGGIVGSGLVAAFGAASAAVGFLAETLGLPVIVVGGIVAAVVALGAALGYHLGAGAAIATGMGRAFEWASDRASSAFRAISDAVAAFKDRVLVAWGGVRDALQTGDLALAARIGWAFVKMEALRAFFAIKGAFLDLVDWLLDGWDRIGFGISRAWADAVGELRKAVVDMTAALQVFGTDIKGNLIRAFTDANAAAIDLFKTAVQTWFALWVDQIGRVASLLQRLGRYAVEVIRDPGKAFEAAQDKAIANSPQAQAAIAAAGQVELGRRAGQAEGPDVARARILADAEKAKARIDAETARQRAEIDARQQDARDKRAAGTAEQKADDARALADAADEFKGLVGDAERQRRAAENTELFKQLMDGIARTPLKFPGLDQVRGGVLATEARGTFSGYMAGQALGIGTSIGKQQLDELKEANKQLDAIKGKMGDGLIMGP
jgi:hypothetical protein